MKILSLLQQRWLLSARLLRVLMTASSLAHAGLTPPRLELSNFSMRDGGESGSRMTVEVSQTPAQLINPSHAMMELLLYSRPRLNQLHRDLAKAGKTWTKLLGVLEAGDAPVDRQPLSELEKLQRDLAEESDRLQQEVRSADDLVAAVEAFVAAPRDDAALACLEDFIPQGFASSKLLVIAAACEDEVSCAAIKTIVEARRAELTILEPVLSTTLETALTLREKLGGIIQHMREAEAAREAARATVKSHKKPSPVKLAQAKRRFGRRSKRRQDHVTRAESVESFALEDDLFDNEENYGEDGDECSFGALGGVSSSSPSLMSPLSEIISSPVPAASPLPTDAESPVAVPLTPEQESVVATVVAFLRVLSDAGLAADASLGQRRKLWDDLAQGDAAVFSKPVRVLDRIEAEASGDELRLRREQVLSSVMRRRAALAGRSLVERRAEVLASCAQAILQLDEAGWRAVLVAAQDMDLAILGPESQFFPQKLLSEDKQAFSLLLDRLRRAQREN